MYQLGIADVLYILLLYKKCSKNKRELNYSEVKFIKVSFLRESSISAARKKNLIRNSSHTYIHPYLVRDDKSKLGRAQTGIKQNE